MSDPVVPQRGQVWAAIDGSGRYVRVLQVIRAKFDASGHPVPAKVIVVDCDADGAQVGRGSKRKLSFAAADDDDLLPLRYTTFYEGRYNAQLFDRRSRPDVLYLRLDDGHRCVGTDVEVPGDVTDDVVATVREAWRRLERELGNTRHLVADDPWADVVGGVGISPRWHRQEATFRALINRRQATAAESAGLREGVHFDVYPEQPPASSDLLSDLRRAYDLIQANDRYTPDPPPVRSAMIVQAPLLSDEQREHLEGARRTIDEIMERHWAGAAGVIPDQPPTDAEWALWLRRRRNTGPAAQPLDPRRRGRR